MFGITKSEGYYWVKTGTTTKIGYEKLSEAIAYVITGIA